MDFLLTPEQRAFRQRLRDWLAANLPENWRDGHYVRELDETEHARYQRAWEKKLHAAGYAGLHWPAQYGGKGLSIVEHFLFGEETGRVAAPEGINTIGRELVGGVLLYAGSESQKRTLLPRIAACDDVWCQGFSEPNSGSDLASLRTRGVEHQGKWRINGQKIWTSYAQHADMCLLLARTSDEERQQRGLTLFAMPMKAPGVTRRSIAQLNGQADLNEVFLDGVELGEEAAIGPVGEGWSVAGAVLNIERATTRFYRQARYLNELRHATNLAIGRGGALDASMRQRVATSLAELTVFRALNVKFVSRIANGERIGPESSVLKQIWSHFHQNVTDVCAELLGDDHWLPRADDVEASRFLPVYLHTRAETIFAGTSEVQNNIIAERLLGMPR